MSDSPRLPTSPIIAIDGLSASGKGTLARAIAQHFAFAYLDTGSLYRAVALIMERAHNTSDTADNVQKAAESLMTMDNAALDALMGDPVLRSEITATLASVVSSMPAVRQALLVFQQNFAAHPPQGMHGAVLDGRDIGTVVCPHACAKLFITASLDVRAHRRFKELQGRGECVKEHDVWNVLHARDERDSSRSVAPALPADDAYVIDTSMLTVSEVYDKALAIVTPKLKRF